MDKRTDICECRVAFATEKCSETGIVQLIIKLGLLLCNWLANYKKVLSSFSISSLNLVCIEQMWEIPDEKRRDVIKP